MATRGPCESAFVEHTRLRAQLLNCLQIISTLPHYWAGSTHAVYSICSNPGMSIDLHGFGTFILSRSQARVESSHQLPFVIACNSLHPVRPHRRSQQIVSFYTTPVW